MGYLGCVKCVKKEDCLALTYNAPRLQRFACAEFVGSGTEDEDAVRIIPVVIEGKELFEWRA